MLLTLLLIREISFGIFEIIPPNLLEREYFDFRIFRFNFFLRENKFGKFQKSQNELPTPYSNSTFGLLTGIESYN